MENNYVEMPIAGLRAALKCAAAGKEAPAHLKGVYLHVTQGAARAVATDGTQRLIVTSIPFPDEVPEWLEQGVILPGDALGSRLAMLASVKVGDMPSTKARIGYLDSDRVTMEDVFGECLFRLHRIQADYIDYQRGLGPLDVFEGREMKDMESTAFDPTQLKGTAEVAAILGSSL